jgi:hypothetical protein
MENEIPPSTNRGVTKNTQTSDQDTNIKMTFDWFQGLLQGDYEEIEKRLLVALQGFYDELRYSKEGHRNVFVQRGWQRGMSLLRNNITVFSISYGGQNGKHGNWFKTTGSNAQDIAHLLQNEFGHDGDVFKPGELSVSRIDVAIDIRADFMNLVNSAITQVVPHNLKLNQMGDWLSEVNEDGRTLYLKATENSKMRIYEKGKQMRLIGEDENAPLDWVRLEIEIHAPDGKQSHLFRQIMAGQTPETVWQSYKPYVDILKATGIADLDYIPIQKSVKPVPTDFERKHANMINQYGNQLRDGFTRPGYLAKLISGVFPMVEDIPEHLKPLLFDHLENDQFLKHGEY